MTDALDARIGRWVHLMHTDPMDAALDGARTTRGDEGRQKRLGT
jgi:hypothetical protein